MANLTRSEMIDFTMRRLGVLGKGQSADANDAAEVGRVLDSIYYQYRKRGRAPFATSAWPEWAQVPFAKIAGYHVAPHFGLQRSKMDEQEGRVELTEQIRAKQHPSPVRFKAY